MENSFEEKLQHFKESVSEKIAGLLTIIVILLIVLIFFILMMVYLGNALRDHLSESLGNENANLILGGIYFILIFFWAIPVRMILKEKAKQKIMKWLKK